MGDEFFDEREDEREPTPERQAELRAGYERNTSSGRSFRERVFAIRTRGELHWLMREQGWSGEVIDDWRERRVRLMGVNFYGADLRGVHLYMAGLMDSTFSHADLRGAILIGADLQDTGFSRTNLEGAHLAGAYLTHAGLSGANLRGANLVHADLSHAGLRGADLRGADLFGADLSHADLSGADLRGADVRTRLFDQDTKLYNIVIDSETRLAWGMSLQQPPDAERE